MNNTFRDIGLWLSIPLILTGFVPIIQILILTAIGGLVALIGNTIGYYDDISYFVITYSIFIPLVSFSTYKYIMERKMGWIFIHYVIIIIGLYAIFIFIMDPIGQYLWSLPTVGGLIALFLIIIGLIKDRKTVKPEHNIQ